MNRTQPSQTEDAPTTWEAWLRAFFPQYTRYPFAAHHRDFWEWLWAIELGGYVPPFVGAWSRGGGKSSSIEMGIAALAARDRRRFGIYVCETQKQADEHVETIAAMFESAEFGRAYPRVASKAIGQYGNQLGWRQSRLRTASGFTIDAVGLNKAVRGLKYEDRRPDFIILDDIDSEADSTGAVDKKIETLTKSVLPAGSSDAITMVAQNLLHANSIITRLVDGRADFLADRIVSGPVPALEHAEFEQVDGKWTITAGEPTWAGQDIEACRRIITRDGLASFKNECQHDVAEQRGGMFDHIDFRHCTWDEVPDLVRVVLWEDPAVTNTDASDSHGIQCDGIAADGTIYRLFSWEDRTSPEDAMERSILKALELKSECVGVETDQGGDTWKVTYNAAWRALRESGRVPESASQPQFRSEKAGAGFGPKAHRASQMLTDYEQGRIVHVLGTHQTLERALRRFPKVKPFDLTDAAFWAWRNLRAVGSAVEFVGAAQPLPSAGRQSMGGMMYGRG